MKSLLNLLRTTITGGILFLLPVVLIIVILNKARLILVKISAPITDRLPDIILGLDGSKLITIVLLILICFVSGLLFRSPTVRRWINKLEDEYLSYLPGYTMMKSITSDVIGDKNDHGLVTVLVLEEETWQVGFLIEENKDHCTVFFPEAPRHESGELKIVPLSWVTKVNVKTRETTKSLQRYGKGTLSWLEHNKPDLTRK
jgi:uncharacterized membrane protein